MTPPNRYDRLNEVETDSAPLFGEEAWIQLPDGSWVRSTDKAAKKLKNKTKGRAEPGAESIPAAPPPPPPPAPEPVEQPKRRLGRKSAADKQRQAELDRQAEMEREAQRARRADQERERRAEMERDRLAELERERLAEQELERQAELERERKTELERKAALERARATELEREIELERARVARLTEEVERERQRQADLEYERERERQKRSSRDDLETGSFPRWPDEQTVYPEPERWPEPAGWPSVEPWSASEPPVPEPKAQRKPARAPEPRRRKTSRGQVSVGRRVGAVAAAAGMAAVAVAIGAGIKWIGPDPASALRPFAKAGAPGESLNVRTFTITVQTARAATSLQAGGAAQPTQGVWVIVRVRLIANLEPTHVGYAAVRDGAGRTFLASDRVKQPLIDGSRAFQPGIPIEGEVVFEVPQDALDGLTVLFAAHPDRLAMDTMAEVVLPSLAMTPAEQPPATLAPTEVKP